MSLNEIPTSERAHIGIFGRRNAGKSSVINAITGQNTAIVSDVMGTTTDPVYKAMELLPLGPVVLIDTPGLDDLGELGEQRVRRALRVLNKADLALLVADAREPLGETEERLIGKLREKGIPYLVARNKSDLLADRPPLPGGQSYVSAKTGEGIHELKERLAALSPSREDTRRIVGDLICPSDLIVLVVPIDKAAPKGRLILPQQQTIRDILESGASAVVTRELELRETLESLNKKPRLVITDSQVFAKADADTPRGVQLTSFSILFARYKGELPELARGARAADRLKDGDRVLVCEGCTHHRQCEDIGTVKIPRYLRRHTGKSPEFTFVSGSDFPDDLSPYRLIIHCGGCTLNAREMKFRIKCAKDQNIPIVNYGVLIAHMQGILKRSLEPFPDILMELEK